MRKKILVNYIIILIISALVTGALAFYFVNNNYLKIREESLVSNSTLIESVLQEYFKDIEEINYFRLAQNLSKTTNIRVTFFNMEGRPIADSLNNSIILTTDPYYQEFQYTYTGTGENEIVRRYSKEVGQKYFYLTTGPIDVGNDRVILRLGDIYDDSDHMIEEILNYFAIALIISIIFAIPFSYILAGYIVVPIRKLTEVSKSVASGNFDNEILINSRDEIGELSTSFNQMTENLEGIIKEMNKTNREINSILTSIQDGVLALDLDGKVISVNDGVRRNLGLDRDIVIGEDINKVFDSLDYIKNIKEGIISSKNYNFEISIKENEKIVSIDSYPIIEKDKTNNTFGTLIIIRDISDIRNLEKMRKDFVANISHELRTPLTSIIGFIETLKFKDLEKKDRDKALDIIDFEAKRLRKLISELLKLSKIQSDIENNFLGKVNLQSIIHEVLALLEPQIREKEIDIEDYTDENINHIYVDRELIKLVVINLIQNGIRYNKQGGNLYIGLYNYKDGIKLVVKDSGVGIPKEDIPWIFERFYRTDKSRSNKEAGTGLGLSIVKEIVEEYGGTIECSSDLDKGSQFTIKIYPN